jgi:predicted hotdog family 3-hydroxylacyl-ACP dehydratase
MLNREDIGRRIPHQGTMCLLERVVAWSAERIECEATGHRTPDHPLRAHGRLGIACGIEYAAQAMAVHGALVGESAGQGTGSPRAGYLASVRGVSLHARRLDDVPGDLTVRAERVMGDDNNIVYAFEVAAAGRCLLSGRATVVLDASIAARMGAKGDA